MASRRSTDLLDGALMRSPSRAQPMMFDTARTATRGDLADMASLPERPGRNSVGPRSLAYRHPDRSENRLEAHFSAYPEGTFISEEEGQIIGYVCSVRVSEDLITTPAKWADLFPGRTEFAPQTTGGWLYVSHFACTAGLGHAHLSNEIGPLLTALQHHASQLDLTGVAFPARFAGLRERSGTDAFQRSTIADPRSLDRSGLRPIGVAYYRGFRHGIALPNYLGDSRHFALMVWKAHA